MNCYHEGILMAYLDHQLSPAEMTGVAEHISRCPRCRKRMAVLQQELAFTSELLEDYRSAAEGPLRQGAVEMLDGVQAESALFKGKDVNKLMRNWQRFQKVAAAVATVALLAGMFSFAPVRGYASQLLQVFRVNQVQVLHFNPQDVQALQQSLQTYGKDTKIESFGDIRRDQVTDFARLGADSVRIGSETISAPAQIGAYHRTGDYSVKPGEKISITPKVAGINGLLSSMGSKQLLPVSLNGKTFTIEVPPVVNATYQDASGNKITLCRSIAPVINVPDGVNVEAVRQAVLGIPILPQRMKDTLAGIQNWGSTMIVPDFGYEQSGAMEELAVNGNQGLFITPKLIANSGVKKLHNPGNNRMEQAQSVPSKLLLWPQGNVWSGMGGDFNRDQALALAAAL
jgi:hypothetical protein